MESALYFFYWVKTDAQIAGALLNYPWPLSEFFTFRCVVRQKTGTGELACDSKRFTSQEAGILPGIPHSWFSRTHERPWSSGHVGSVKLFSRLLGDYNAEGKGKIQNTLYYYKLSVIAFLLHEATVRNKLATEKACFFKNILRIWSA